MSRQYKMVGHTKQRILGYLGSHKSISCKIMCPIDCDYKIILLDNVYVCIL